MNYFKVCLSLLLVAMLSIFPVLASADVALPDSETENTNDSDTTDDADTGEDTNDDDDSDDNDDGDSDDEDTSCSFVASNAQSPLQLFWAAAMLGAGIWIWRKQK